MLPMFSRSTSPPRCAIRAATRGDIIRIRLRLSCTAALKCCVAGNDVAILALGNTCDAALDAYDLLERGEEALPTVVNMRFVRPLDEHLLLELAQTHERFITLEEHSLAGGFGSAVVEFASDRALRIGIERIGVPNVIIQHDKQAKQRASFGLSGELLAARIFAGVPAGAR